MRILRCAGGPDGPFWIIQMKGISEYFSLLGTIAKQQRHKDCAGRGGIS